MGMAAGGSLGMGILSAVAGQLVGSMLTGGKKQEASQPLQVEKPPAAATTENTQSAADSAAAQEKKRMAGASGRSDTVKTDANLGALGDQNKETKSLLGY